ncbi:hypothetical protein [Photobacterium sanguinicancri]|uniref:hypothetical protein n=1 Tax=Photobacterium sanguinicancri TaxID=875932 RepID=UPI0026E31789|nr:hypothetical protein [Photobacterium sanguinicancri]MDO6501204.1 hypothetical protein [Photobacterium sanguinicancri]
MTEFIKMRDRRIEGDNFLLQIKIKDYLNISRNILKKNEFQRRRVRASKSVYSLLKEDLIKGCVIPPISLALNKTSTSFESQLRDGITQALTDNNDSLLILDGLQRTYSIIDIEKELLQEHDLNDELVQTFYNHQIRLEIYSGLNKLGILYRMLTLNTGQTPMSLRQQVEMLYLDYSDIDISGIEIIKESDGSSTSEINQYNFKEIVEGFNSYVERNELPIARQDVLDNIKSLQKLADENSNEDIFKEYVETIHLFIEKLSQLTNNHKLDEDVYDVSFGADTIRIFKRSQSFTGFGAALGKLKDNGNIHSFQNVKRLINELTLDGDSIEDFIATLNDKFGWIKKHSSKIGNAQRNYFHFFYRELFNEDSDSYLDLTKATISAFDRYNSLYN